MLASSPAIARNGSDFRRPSVGTLARPTPTAAVAATPLRAADALLRRRLTELSRADAEFWTFAPSSRRRADVQRYYQYPAMMVPEMQRELLSVVLDVQKGVKRLLDPFAGSGTVLTAALFAGLQAYGQDINPLAVLVSRSKLHQFEENQLRGRCEATLDRAVADADATRAADFPNLTKWFGSTAIIQLSRLRRAIRLETDIDVRRFLWVALAETVRLTSNSRTSTYKLHIRPKSEIAGLQLPLQVFRRVLRANMDQYVASANAIAESVPDFQRRVWSGVDCRLGDSREPFDGIFDLLVTSPPYGDNTSTVPYGQSSYLPLQWIDFADIDADADRDAIKTTHEIDRRSLGGVHQRGDLFELAAPLTDRSAVFGRTLERLRDLPRDRACRVYSFVRDLDSCIQPAVDALRPNAYLIWTVGNRRVGGHQVPLDRILVELMAQHQVVHVETIHRRIPTKRMATRNSLAATMRAEETVILRKLPPSGTAGLKTQEQNRAR